MLHGIRTRAATESAPSNTVTLLMDCHQRIRAFTATALRIAKAADAPESEIAAAATQVHRYFTLALPFHAADEDLSLAPRLRAPGVPSDVTDALETVAREHHAIEAVIAALAPNWAEVARDPRLRSVLANALSERAEQLDALWREHLALEERAVFPAVRKYLDPATLGEIVREMRARRTPGADSARVQRR